MGNSNRLTIISHNCSSYFIHKHLGWEYLTPFVDLYISPENYIRLLSKFCVTDFNDVSLIDKSLWLLNGGEDRSTEYWYYPIINLNNRAICHGIHYSCFQEFWNKWRRRVEKMNFQNLLFIYMDFKETENRDKLLQDFMTYTESFNSIIFTDKNVSSTNKRLVVEVSYESFDSNEFKKLLSTDKRLLAFLVDLKGNPLENRE